MGRREGNTDATTEGKKWGNIPCPSSLPFADGMYDVVLWQQGLQFAPDRLNALGEMRRVLTSGGRVAVSV